MVTDDKGSNNEKAGKDANSEEVSSKELHRDLEKKDSPEDAVAEEKEQSTSDPEERAEHPVDAVDRPEAVQESGEVRASAGTGEDNTESSTSQQAVQDTPDASGATAPKEDSSEADSEGSVRAEITEDASTEEESDKGTVEEEDSAAVVAEDKQSSGVAEQPPEEADSPATPDKAEDISAETAQETTAAKPADDKKQAQEPVGASSREEAAAGPDEKQESTEDHSHDHVEEEEDEGHHLDYSNYTKKQMIQVLESLLKEDDMVQVSRILKEIKPAYDDLYEAEKEEAFKKYLEEGGEKDGFEYKDDDKDQQFQEAYNTLRDRKNEHFSSLDKQRNDNLFRKQELLERLREMVDSEETIAGINDLKRIQQEWRQIGPVAPQHMKSLWANYNALIDRYYDQRSIYFELKELDRKKNLKLKLELCDRAEKLVAMENIRDAIRELNELHEEFKLIGPVPKEDQEPLWQRFKAASDQVYSRRKDHYDELKEQLNLNLTAKLALVEKVEEYRNFNSDRISEWNDKTREILAMQKEWESIGGMPRDRAKDVNKSFWSAFKTFFANKGAFFKHLEESRKDNLEKKEALVAEAEALKDSADFDKTAEALKKLQRDWKDIGPVPQRQRDEIFKRFKAACDHFFERRRANQGKIEQDYKQNLERKEALCKELESMEEGKADPDRISEIIEEFSEIGFVPRNVVKKIHHRFSDAAASAVENTSLPEEKKHKLKFNAQFQKMNFGPGADRFLQKKENSLRRQIAKLENDISLWKNNLDYFADSKRADKVKDEFNKKIDKATREMKGLKEQLSMLSRI